jgi:hypothetical protein
MPHLSQGTHISPDNTARDRERQPLMSNSVVVSWVASVRVTEVAAVTLTVQPAKLTTRGIRLRLQTKPRSNSQLALSAGELIEAK